MVTWDKTGGKLVMVKVWKDLKCVALAVLLPGHTPQA